MWLLIDFDCSFFVFFFFKQKTAYEMRISDWSSDVCSSDLGEDGARVVFECAQPRCYVGGMIGPRMVSDPEVGEYERCGQFSANFLDRQAVALETFGKVAVEPVLCPCGVGRLMQKRAHLC